MAKPRSDGRPALLGQPPEDVRVTVVLPGGRGDSIRRRIAQTPVRARAVLVLGMVAAAAIGVAVSPGGLGATAHHEQRQRGAAYASAAQCPRASPVLDRPNAWRKFDHTVWCERYAGRTSASASYRFIGAPLPVFDSSSR